MTTTEPARATQEDARKQQLNSLIETWNLERKNWVLQAISNCVLGASSGYQKNVFRHLIKRVLDPLRVDPGVQADSLLLLGNWKQGEAQYPKTYRKDKGRAFWTVEFPYFNLVGRGNRPRTVLNSAWKTTKTSRKKRS